MLSIEDANYLAGVLPFFSACTRDEFEAICRNSSLRNFPQKTVLQHGMDDCSGLLVVKTGQLRAYIISESGREVTVFRLGAGDICIVTASCALKNVRFNITVETERSSSVYVIPTNIFSKLNQSNTAVAEFAYEHMAQRLSDVMWIIEQTMFASFDKRLAAFLLEQYALDKTKKLTITHEAIANHLGSAREVVSRMLKYFSEEGVVKLSRGTVAIEDVEKLTALSR